MDTLNYPSYLTCNLRLKCYETPELSILVTFYSIQQISNDNHTGT